MNCRKRRQVSDCGGEVFKIAALDRESARTGRVEALGDAEAKAGNRFARHRSPRRWRARSKFMPPTCWGIGSLVSVKCVPVKSASAQGVSFSACTIRTSEAAWSGQKVISHFPNASPDLSASFSDVTSAYMGCGALKMPEDVLITSCTGSEDFDHPFVYDGRINAHEGRFELMMQGSKSACELTIQADADPLA